MNAVVHVVKISNVIEFRRDSLGELVREALGYGYTLLWRENKDGSLTVYSRGPLPVCTSIEELFHAFDQSIFLS